MEKIISEVLGFIGVALNMAVYQQKKRNRLLIIKLVSDVVWTLHYGLMGNYSGAAVTTIGIARESTFLAIDKKGIDRRPFLLFGVVYLGRLVQRSARYRIVFVGYQLLAAKAAGLSLARIANFCVYADLFHIGRLNGGNS